MKNIEKRWTQHTHAHTFTISLSHRQKYANQHTQNLTEMNTEITQKRHFHTHIQRVREKRERKMKWGRGRCGGRVNNAYIQIETGQPSQLQGEAVPPGNAAPLHEKGLRSELIPDA